MALDHHRGGSGEPLLLIHGIGHTWRGWRPMLPRLEERFEVLAVDLPGFGHSEPFPPGLDSTPEALADAVEDEMARAGFDKAHIAGNSLAARPVAAEPPRTGPVRRTHLHARVEKESHRLKGECELFASNQGFEATLPHTFGAQPRGLTSLD